MKVWALLRLPNCGVLDVHPDFRFRKRGIVDNITIPRPHLQYWAHETIISRLYAQIIPRIGGAANRHIYSCDPFM